MKYITLQQIKQHNPCPDQYRKARRIFGKHKRIAVTVKAAVTVAPLFDWTWLASKLLSAPALKAYDEAMAAALKAYDEATAAAQKAYNEARTAALKAYDEATAAALKAYNEATAATWKAYAEATAAAFARAYQSM